MCAVRKSTMGYTGKVLMFILRDVETDKVDGVATYRCSSGVRARFHGKKLTRFVRAVEKTLSITELDNEDAEKTKHYFIENHQPKFSIQTFEFAVELLSGKEKV